MIYIFDIDGTLADLSHRLHLITRKPDHTPNAADWRAFFAACPNDKPIDEVIRVARILWDAGYGIVLISGRSDEVEAATTSWLVKHDVQFSGLYMRKQGDHREDSVVKSELLDQLIKDRPGGVEIGGVFEDRKQVVDMYRARGLRVFQVADGNF